MQAYRLHEEGDHLVTLERVGQLHGPDLWAVRRGRWCLDKSGEWAIDRIPPEMPIREYVAQHRWVSPEEAYGFWLAQEGETT